MTTFEQNADWRPTEDKATAADFFSILIQEVGDFFYWIGAYNQKNGISRDRLRKEHFRVFWTTYGGLIRLVFNYEPDASGSVVHIEPKFKGLRERSDPFEDMLASKMADRIVGVMFPDGVEIENRFTFCAGPCGLTIPVLCESYAGRHLCRKCRDTLSIMKAPLEAPKAEKTERQKLTPGLRWDTLERFRFTCQSCGRQAPVVKLEIDHILPISAGGKTEPENLQILCMECNRGKSDKPLKHHPTRQAPA